MNKTKEVSKCKVIGTAIEEIEQGDNVTISIDENGRATVRKTTSSDNE